jgi:hypothetical protein
LFEKGKRLEPPSIVGMVKVSPTKVIIIQSTDNFILKTISEYAKPIRGFFAYNATGVAYNDNTVYIGKIEYYLNETASDIIILPKNTTPIEVGIDHGKLFIRDMKTDKEIPIALSARNKMVVDNNVYVLTDTKIVEVGISDAFTNTVASIGLSLDIMPNSTKMFRGVVYQEMLGKKVFLFFFKKPGAKTSSFRQIILPELDKFTIVDAKYELGVLIVITYLKGIYSKFIYKFNLETGEKSFRFIDNISNQDINFVVLDNGIVVCINENDEVEIFRNIIGYDDVKLIKDPIINSSIKLTKDGMRVLFCKGNKVYQLSIK